MVGGFSCILDFPKYSWGGPLGPPYKGNTSIKTLKIFLQQQQQPKAKKDPKSPPPLKQSTRNLSLGYTEIEKGRRALGQDLFCVICNWAV